MDHWVNWLAVVLCVVALVVNFYVIFRYMRYNIYDRRTGNLLSHRLQPEIAAGRLGMTERQLDEAFDGSNRLELEKLIVSRGPDNHHVIEKAWQ